MSSRTVLIASLLFLATVPFAGMARADDDRHARLDHGEIIVDTKDFPGSDVPEATMTAVVDAPIEKLWQIVDHCSEYMNTMTRIKTSKELSRAGNTVRCETTFSSPWPMKDLHAITVATHSAGPLRWSREWKLESGDYKDNHGSWTLTAWAPGRTLVEYRVHSEPNVSVPAWLLKAGISVALPGLIDKLRSEVQ